MWKMIVPAEGRVRVWNGQTGSVGVLVSTGSEMHE